MVACSSSRCSSSRLGRLPPKEHRLGVPIVKDPSLRGLTLLQLRALHARASELCISEAWRSTRGTRLNPEELSLSDLVRWLVRPETEVAECSLAELMSETPRRVDWLVNCAWSVPFEHVLAMMERHALDRGLPPDITSYFVSARSQPPPPNLPPPRPLLPLAPTLSRARAPSPRVCADLRSAVPGSVAPSLVQGGGHAAPGGRRRRGRRQSRRWCCQHARRGWRVRRGPA
jgi:hypothetical protein